MLPFAVSKEYARQRLLDFVGSRQTQSGVLWGPREPGCIICTSGGRHGKKAGYYDEELPDGSWWYFGQGTKGDQVVSNPANSKLATLQYSVLLFTTREPTSKEILAQGYGKLFAYRGMFNVLNYEPYRADAGNRINDQLLRFRFVPVEELPTESSDMTKATAKYELKALLDSRAPPPPQANETVVLYRYRSALVQRYARLRANGFCEGCGDAAPFVTEYQEPFLEVHHLLRLADEGPDTPENVAALCPNCHRRAHYGADRHEFNRHLQIVMANTEANDSPYGR